MTTKEIFFPPGVQAKMFGRFGRCPKSASPAIADHLDSLWQRRNVAPDEELAEIDSAMEELAATITPE